MAIYHCSVKTISRSKGQSAVASAAYRSGAKLHDERIDMKHDYSRKSGVFHSEIVLPEGANQQFLNREKLWNAAEHSEKRKNSTVAREYEVALPSELRAEQRHQLTTTFAKWLADRHGVAVDLAIHAPGKEGDQRNHHAHILTTTRKIEGDQLTDKTRELDDKKTGAVIEVREKWAELANSALELAQVPDRVDHRSLDKQGIERLPQIHLGPVASEMERRGEASERGEINRFRASLNQAVELAGKAFTWAKEKAQEMVKPLTRAEELSKQAESFSTKDLEKLRAEKLSKQAEGFSMKDLEKLRAEKDQERRQEKSRAKGRKGPALER